LKGKAYNVVGDVDAATTQLRQDFEQVKSVLSQLTLEKVDELVQICSALQKWMRFLSTDVSKEIVELDRVMQQAKKWKNKAAGHDGLQHRFPFAEKTYRSFNDLVRVIDQLRKTHGTELDGMGINLPEIVAVGTESAGKSSVMEMIAGQPFFPRHEGTCTRLPFRLRFMHSKTNVCSVSFEGVAGPLSTAAEVQNRIAAITKQRTDNKDVSTEELVLKIEMGDVPELTLVDLPGLIGTTYASEGQSLREKVRNLVKSYVSKPHAIVLAIAAANTRLRDSEVFGMEKELGAEDRTIGLLTKCDLATDKRWKLEDKLGKKLAEASTEEQEKAGFIPLKRGYYAMICRDTENMDRSEELEQNQEAIVSVKNREAQAFDEIIRDPDARKRCGVDTVYNVLVKLLEQYIVETWKPDAMRKIAVKIAETRLAMQGLRFSDRYPQDPPPSSEANTVKYKQEVQVRVKTFNHILYLVACSELEMKLLKKVPKEPSDTPTGFAQFKVELQKFGDQLMASFKDVQKTIWASIHCVLASHIGTKDLPHLRSLIVQYIGGQLTSWFKEETDRLQVLLDIEGVDPIDDQGPYRMLVNPMIQSIVLQLSGETECSICHQDMHTGKLLEVYQCCGKHFHFDCIAPQSFYPRSSCPLCRANVTTPATLVTPVTSAFGTGLQQELPKWNVKHLHEARKRLLEQMKRSIAVVVRKIATIKLDNELGETLAGPLLEETLEMQERRRTLQEKLSILESVQEEIDQWSSMKK